MVKTERLNEQLARLEPDIVGLAEFVNAEACVGSIALSLKRMADVRVRMLELAELEAAQSMQRMKMFEERHAAWIKREGRNVPTSRK